MRPASAVQRPGAVARASLVLLCVATVAVAQAPAGVLAAPILDGDSEANVLSFTRIQQSDGSFPAPWPARAYYGSVVTSAGRWLVMGGFRRSSLEPAMDDVWASANGGSVWTQLARHGAFGQRWGHAAAVTQVGGVETVVITGGTHPNDDLLGPEVYLNDVWTSAASDGATWTQVADAVPSWSPRAYHSMVALGGGVLMLAFGSNGGSSGLADTHVSTDGGTTWYAQPAAPASGCAECPWPRTEASAVALPPPDGSSYSSRVLMAGGLSPHAPFYMEDAWIATYDAASAPTARVVWSNATQSGSAWPGRSGQCLMATASGEVVLLGGTNYGGDQTDSYTGTVSASKAGVVWTNVTSPTNEGRYTGTEGMCCFVDVTRGGEIVLLGGYSNAQDQSTAALWRSAPVHCPAGTFHNDAEGGCTTCKAGYYSNHAGAASCSQCPAGHISNEARSGCDPCPSGSVAAAAGAWQCVPCAAGSYTAHPGSTLCAVCGPGNSTGADEEGASTCAPCPPTTYSDVVGGTQCVACTCETDGTVCATCPSGCSVPGPSEPLSVKARQSEHGELSVSWHPPTVAGQAGGTRPVTVTEYEVCTRDAYGPGALHATTAAREEPQCVGVSEPPVQVAASLLLPGHTYIASVVAVNSDGGRSAAVDADAVDVSAMCDPPCDEPNGRCDASEGTCVCEPGWTGVTCAMWAWWKVALTVLGGITGVLSLATGMFKLRKHIDARRKRHNKKKQRHGRAAACLAEGASSPSPRRSRGGDTRVGGHGEAVMMDMGRLATSAPSADSTGSDYQRMPD